MAQLSDAERHQLTINRWYASLSAALRQAIEAESLRRELAPGQRLYTRGAAADGWYGLLSGAIKVSSTSPDGREVVLTYLEPGSWFGEISLFDGMPRTHDGQAHAATTVLFVPRERFDALLHAHPELALALLRLQGQRLRLLFAAVEELATQPLETRLARQLRNLVRAYGQPHAEGVQIGLHLPQEELAQLLGVTRQRVNQTLKAWEREGLLRQRYGQIVVTDGNALTRRAALND